ncbi:hypothetical protein L484_015580 [Morus notabilis]|uniref:Uncharacterized protein n=1 Tax=Morus notabilis TaxID=981085 RepID=W9SDF6_9ROSA|nr:hypothetical protein L484_015580 [Morus notabilis]
MYPLSRSWCNGLIVHQKTRLGRDSMLLVSYTMCLTLRTSGSIQKQVTSWARPLAHEGEVHPEVPEGTNGRDREGAADLTRALTKEE